MEWRLPAAGAGAGGGGIDRTSIDSQRMRQLSI